jgi:inorganic triphosphatase YgiF
MLMGERPREIELKLELPAGEAARLKRALREDPRLAEPPRTDLLVSTYFDTDRRDLREAGVSLRVRREGKRSTQTIKQSEGPAAGSFDRAEWERDIVGGKPDLKAAEGTALAPLLSKRLRARLKPVFRTAVNRTTYRLKKGHSAINIGFDQGHIQAGRRSSRLAEVEFELERGEPAELFALARRLGAREPPRLQIKSKAERGYDLIANAASTPVKFAKLELARGTSSAQAFRLIAHACLRQLIGNEPALQQGDAEAVHQMRTALRRLRAAFSLFSALVSDAELARLKGEIKWITGELAPARELDVYLTEAVQSAKNGDREGTMSVLDSDLRRRRAQAVVRAKAAAASPRYRSLLLDLVAWIETGAWANPRDAAARRRLDRPVQKLAVKQLARRRRKIKKRGRTVRELEPQQRHKLRIAIKKVHYAAGFFAALFPGPRAKKRRKVFLATIKRLQDALGTLNDIAGHEKMAGELVRRSGRRSRARAEAFAVGLVTGREEARSKPLILEAADAIADFRKIKPFWR